MRRSPRLQRDLAMTMTHAELLWMHAELAEHLTQAAIQKVYDGPERQHIFQVRRPGQTLLLLLDTSPQTSRAHFIAERPTSGGAHPAAFTMLMRKWIQGMVIREVTLKSDDRVLTLSGDRIHPDWEPAAAEDDAPQARPPRVPVSLVVEWLGQQTNMFVLGPAGEVLGFEVVDEVEGRALRRADIWSAPSPSAPSTHNRFVASPQQGGEEAGELWRSARAASWYARNLGAHASSQAMSTLAKRLKREHKRTKKRIKNVERDLERAIEAQLWKQWGELLQSGYGKIPRGARVARVPNYYEEGMPLVEIPLEPARSLQQNIDHYFKQYRRMHSARALIEERLLEAMEQAEALEHARARLEEATDLDEQALTAWTLELEQAKLIPRANSPRARRASSRKEARKPYRTFASLQGKTILVGRNASGNDEVSTHVARGRDMWLHAKDWAGSHVLLRLERGEEPKQADLLDAAMLAAHFSKGARDTLIDVTYTRAKHVRKPKGYPVGRVTVAGGSTLGVSRDEQRLEQLLESETE